ncbi:carbohydrate kinase family protein [Streptomyces niveus]|uniref:Carbohydrate kinase family protein n=1 Tax=Streptomyces niveus TaxID=193462 RepID=A0ABZ2A2I1_STRNV|nr:carbohydrate kinase family protein [Streptomyces niveus]
MPLTFDLLVIGEAGPYVMLGPIDAPLDALPDTPLALGGRAQRVDSGVLTLGGSAALTACGAARLGLRVAFAGRVGDDDAGDYVRDRLAAHGVNTRALRVDDTLPTPLTTVMTHGGGQMVISAPGTRATTTGDDIPEQLLTRSGHVHCASFFLMPKLAATLSHLFAAAHAAGATTSLGTNDERSGRWDRTALAPVLARTDLLLTDAYEAGRLAGTDGGCVTSAAELLARRGPLVTVRNGVDGALCHDGDTLLTTDGIRVNARDAVGAGDSFNAGFIAAQLAGRPPAEALAIAAVCGALSTRAGGGTAAQPTWAQALAHLTTVGDGPS